MTNVIVADAVEAVAHDLVRVQRINSSSFVNLPLLYPDGSLVTIRIDPVPGGLRVSDNGFAYREAEDVSAIRSFGQNKKSIGEEFGVQFGAKSIYVEAPPDELFGAVCDVAAASWQISSRVFSKLTEDNEQELEEEVSVRLKRLFGPQVDENKDLIGASSVSWPISAVVSFADHKTAFQAVGDHPTSVNRCATAFRDLALLEKPPKLVAVVRSKSGLGPRVTLLTQALARVIERGNPDDMWKAAA